MAQVPNLAYEIVQRHRGVRDSKRLINLQGFLVGACPQMRALSTRFVTSHVSPIDPGRERLDLCMLF